MYQEIIVVLVLEPLTWKNDAMNMNLDLIICNVCGNVVTEQINECGCLSFFQLKSTCTVNLEVGGVVLSGAGHNWSPMAKRSTLKTYVQATLYEINRLYLQIHVHIQIHICK